MLMPLSITSSMIISIVVREPLNKLCDSLHCKTKTKFWIEHRKSIKEIVDSVTDALAQNNVSHTVKDYRK